MRQLLPFNSSYKQMKEGGRFWGQNLTTNTLFLCWL